MNPQPKPALHGVLLLRKPKGWTSFDVVRRIKKPVRPAKVGHTGTLDPMATGLLPVTIGEATKLTRWLSDGAKRYRARIRLGVATDTLDADGQPTDQMPVPALDRAQVEAACARFTGTIEQTPPMYSAVHHQGRRLYQLARAGQEVERKPREVEIHALELTALEAEALEIDVTCSAGTYIRSLAVDLARAVGTVAHLTALERVEAAGFSLDQAVEVDGLDRDRIAESLLSVEDVLARFERVAANDDLARRLANGNRLNTGELQRIGLDPGDSPRVVWFQAPAGMPIILTEVAPAGSDPAMRISRVLHPEAQPAGKAKEKH